MPNFQASLRDSNNDVALTISGATIQIGDYSNYIASTQVGNLLAHFSYKVIIVMKYGETTGYVYATFAGYDGLLSAPNTYVNPALYPPINTNYTYSGDAVYSVTVVTVPDWQKGTSYSIGDNIITGGIIYISNSNTNTSDPHTPGNTNWTALWNILTDSIYDITVASSAYQATEYIAVDCSAWECFADLVYTVNCIELNVDCDDVKLCANDTWRKAMRLSMILDSMQTLMDNGDIDQALQMLNQAQAICSCCNS